MKVYYFLNNLSEENYDFFLDKINLVSDISDIDEIISKYTHKIGLKNEGTTQNANFMEAFMFLKYFMEAGYGKLSDIEWVSKKNFLIYNDEIYFQENNRWNFLNKKVIFATCRDGWQSQFFLYLYNRQKYDKKIKLIKPDYIKDWNYRDKLYFISKIQKYRDEYIGNIIIPLIMDNSKKSVLSLFLFIKYRFGDNFIIKSSIGIMGQGVRALKYSYLKEDENQLLSVIDKFFPSRFYNYNCPYITPYYNIKKEFRIYYVRGFDDDKFKVYSVKNRENTVTGDLYNKKDMTYDSINTVWLYNDLNNFHENYKHIYKKAKKITKYLGLETGVIELCELEGGDVKFLEVNPLGGTLMYSGEDENNMKQFYLDIWKKQFDRIKIK